MLLRTCPSRPHSRAPAKFLHPNLPSPAPLQRLDSSPQLVLDRTSRWHRCREIPIRAELHVITRWTSHTSHQASKPAAVLVQSSTAPCRPSCITSATPTRVVPPQTMLRVSDVKGPTGPQIPHVTVQKALLFFSRRLYRSPPPSFGPFRLASAS